ncbi:MAG: transferrin-binding protein-like solute binding protein [Pseudomonadota bacterium]
MTVCLKMKPVAGMAAACVLLAGCGGSGDNSFGGNPLPGQPTQNQSLDNLAVSQTFQTTSGTIVGDLAVGTGAPLSFNTAQSGFGSQVELQYNASNDSYTVRINQGGLSRTETFRPSDIDAALSDQTFTAYARGDQLLGLLTPNNPITPLSFVGYGAWQDVRDQGSSVRFETAFFTYGIRTAANDIPVTGPITYNGIVDGFWNPGDGLRVLGGTVSFTADFPNDRINGTFDMVGESITSTNIRPFGIFDAVGTISSGQNEFSGTLQNRVSATNTGFFDGAFFGPDAVEIGGTFRLTGFGQAVGVFVGSSN